MSLLTTSDAEIYYEFHGDGPPLVLIHGASGTSSNLHGDIDLPLRGHKQRIDTQHVS